MGRAALGAQRKLLESDKHLQELQSCLSPATSPMGPPSPRLLPHCSPPCPCFEPAGLRGAVKKPQQHQMLSQRGI